MKLLTWIMGILIIMILSSQLVRDYKENECINKYKGLTINSIPINKDRCFLII